MKIYLIVILLTFNALLAFGQNKKVNKIHFEKLLKTVAEGWNEGNARKAANCFTENAIYTEPPDKQNYVGRERLFQFFGGEAGRKSTMKMTWHNLAFDKQTQIGFGEFTFEYEGGKVHGIVTVKLQNGLISNWREYWYESNLDWEKFIGENKF
jgi:hypothetical protein